MFRWNGWGEETITYPLPASAARYLASRIGEGLSIPDASFAAVVADFPPSRLTSRPFLSIDPVERLRHARGQSLPDWIALRSGRIGVFPDAVAYPTSEDEVRSLIRFARDVGAKLIPFGGGSSVVGHINPVQGDAAVITLDLARLNRLIDFDETSRLATFEAGVRGPDLESQLRGAAAHSDTILNRLNFQRSAVGSPRDPAANSRITMGASKIYLPVGMSRLRWRRSRARDRPAGCKRFHRIA